jgi:nucleotide-binding universal stress UspA family protein
MMKLDSIFVPLDGSRFAEQAVAWAAELCRAAKAKLRLALVHQLPPPPGTADAKKLYTKVEILLRRAQRDYLNKVAKRLKDGGLSKVGSVVLTGEPGPALVEDAVEWGASLVVMSTHGRGPLASIWLGSVTDHVVRHLPIPVLLIRPGDEHSKPGPVDFQGEILVPLDGSVPGETALEPAIAIARLFDMQLSLLQVVQPISDSFAGNLALPVDEDVRLTELFRKEAEDYLKDVAKRVEQEGLRAASAVVLGPFPAASIIAAGEREPVKLVAMATHGQSGVRRFVMGGVTDKVVRGLNRPVLVCRRKPGRR